jgi:dihydroxyacetone kinase-like predicted kinase
MLEGMAAACAGALDMTDKRPFAKTALREAFSSAEPDEVIVEPADSEFQYCTEAVIRLSVGVTKEQLVASFMQKEKEGMGDSVACVCVPHTCCLRVCVLAMHVSGS